MTHFEPPEAPTSEQEHYAQELAAAQQKRVVMLKWAPLGVISRCVSTPQEFAGMIEDCDTDAFRVNVVRMTEAEVEALPEFEGW